MASSEEIEIRANIAAMLILRTVKAPVDGWTALLDANIFLEADAPTKDISRNKLTALLQLAKLEPLAFQAAKALAAEQVALGEPVEPVLRQFAADVLSEKIERPKQQGNRPRGDALLRVMQYVLIRKIACDFCIAIASGERTTLKSMHMPNACEIVAKAFSR